MVGNVTISVEIELGWGYHDLDRDDRYAKISKDRVQETETLNRFLNILDINEIPISFDIVGHLFLDSCSTNHKGVYPQEWFDEDPGTDLRRDPLFYAPDMIDSIEQAKVDHEICTHTFSHVLCDEISSETLQSELETVQRLHRDRFGEATVSLVTPRHRNVPRSVLSDSGIDVLRVPAHDVPDSRLTRLYWYLLGDHPVAAPETKKGVTETYTSPAMSLTAYHLPTGQTRPHPVFRVFPQWIRKKLHKRYLNTALKQVCNQDSNIHLWTHLHDMANHVQWSVISDFVGLLGTAVSDDDIAIKTMSDLTENQSVHSDQL